MKCIVWFACSTVRIRGRWAPIGWEQAGLRVWPRHCSTAGREGECVSKAQCNTALFLIPPCHRVESPSLSGLVLLYQIVLSSCRKQELNGTWRHCELCQRLSKHWRKYTPARYYCRQTYWNSFPNVSFDLVVCVCQSVSDPGLEKKSAFLTTPSFLCYGVGGEGKSERARTACNTSKATFIFSGRTLDRVFFAHCSFFVLFFYIEFRLLVGYWHGIYLPLLHDS